MIILDDDDTLCIMWLNGDYFPNDIITVLKDVVLWVDVGLFVCWIDNDFYHSLIYKRMKAKTKNKH